MASFKTDITTELQSKGAVVSVIALSAGHFSLPENQFIKPASETGRINVPSLSFLIQHKNSWGTTTRILFDLGVRRDIHRYSNPIRQHIRNRQPLSTDPDVVKSLASGGLTPDDIDYVFFSHVHWDHIGEPRDFPQSMFIVGDGSLDLLQGKTTSLRGGHSHFEADLLPPVRTHELLPVQPPNKEHVIGEENLPKGEFDLLHPWKSLGELPAVMDVFHDGSLFIVDAPGHLPGHINLLANTETGLVYLAGDACHDRRLLRGEVEIGEWHDDRGQLCCIHVDRATAEETIKRVRRLEEQGVLVIIAHDSDWEKSQDKTIPLWDGS